MNLQAGEWTLIGNPGQVPVSVEGADVVEAYDPVSNAFTTVTELHPGQGAWANSAQGGPITVVPES